MNKKRSDDFNKAMVKNILQRASEVSKEKLPVRTKAWREELKSMRKMGIGVSDWDVLE